MSFGFQVVKDRWGQAGADGLPVRELLEVRLLDVSPVTFPAYQQTEVHVRAIMNSVLSRIESGGIAQDERRAMSLAVRNILEQLEAEPGMPHSEEHQSEPGDPHSEQREGREPGAPPHSEERRRTLLDRRRRLLELATL
jgi:hypothetical protein